MQVNTIRVTGVAHLADGLASGDVLTDFNISRHIEMHVHRTHTVIVVDDAVIAHIPGPADRIDGAGVHGINRTVLLVTVDDIRTGMAEITAPMTGDRRVVDRPDVVAGTDQIDLLGTYGNDTALWLLDDVFR